MLMVALICWWGSLSLKWFKKFVSVMVSIFVLIAMIAWYRYEKWVVETIPKIQQVREEFPVVAIEDRLPPQVRESGAVQLSQTSRNHLDELENSDKDSIIGFREITLRRLHEGSVEDFVRREGFGRGRMPSFVNMALNLEYYERPPVPQPNMIVTDAWKRIEMNREYQNSEPISFLSAHSSNILDFVAPINFGYMQSKKRFAGFKGHQINSLHEPETWAINRLELVGLLLAPKPRVYVSEYLPSMEQMRVAKTRPLNFFEAEGLAKLEGGDELFFREEPGGMRMLGALRIVKQCMKCHDGERGDLLGAFSYILEKKRVPSHHEVREDIAAQE